MKIVNKVFLILSLLLLYEVSTVYSKINRKYKRNHNHRIYKRGENEGLSDETKDCLKATFNGLLNFVAGFFHGFIGLDKKFNLSERCESFGDQLKEFAKFLEIDTEGINLDFAKLDSIDSDYLKFIEMTTDEKKKLSQEKLQKFEAQKKKNDNQFKNFKCFDNEKNALAEFAKNVQETFKYFSDVIEEKDEYGILQGLGIGGKFVYCKVCNVRKIIFLIVSILLNPGKISQTTVESLIKEVVVLLKTLNVEGVELGQNIRATYDMFINVFRLIANSQIPVISDISKIGVDISDSIESIIGKAKEIIIDVLSNIKEQIKKIINDIKPVIKAVITAIKTITTLFSDKLYSFIESTGILKQIDKIVDNIMSSPGLTKNKTVKEEFDIVIGKAKTIYKALLSLAVCLKAAIGASIKIVKSAISLVNNITTIVSALTRSVDLIEIPIFIILIFEVALTIACDKETWSNFFLAFKYSFTSGSAYSLGGSLGLALKAIGLPQSSALKIFQFIEKNEAQNDGEFKLPDIEKHFGKITNNFTDKDKLVEGIFFDKVWTDLNIDLEKPKSCQDQAISRRRKHFRYFRNLNKIK